ncbi:hypothetical protein EDEG_03549 [Edhazardia aedis USNM 41457]|uniref:Uncharacterized protein n=1 Tax=Edhazardia aedis (strain USNM 41457) TaxID=1003232 RepID=J9D346_EDHAE|nr:hypothetical protein EDEG_03549 [Edhazardia aedis USNM 41457]|eukprot:EJW01994.1 hypothetical protein EDEG_03549 [Edhazardia aedis USNM 41457]
MEKSFVPNIFLQVWVFLSLLFVYMMIPGSDSLAIGNGSNENLSRKNDVVVTKPENQEIKGNLTCEQSIFLDKVSEILSFSMGNYNESMFSIENKTEFTSEHQNATNFQNTNEVSDKDYESQVVNFTDVSNTANPVISGNVDQNNKKSSFITEYEYYDYYDSTNATDDTDEELKNKDKNHINTETSKLNENSKSRECFVELVNVVDSLVNYLMPHIDKRFDSSSMCVIANEIDDPRMQEYKNLHTTLQEFLDKRLLKTPSKFSILYDELFLEDNSRRYAIDQIIKFDKVKNTLNKMNKSKIYPNDSIVELLQDFEDFREKSKNFQFLQAFIKEMNFEHFKYKIEEDNLNDANKNISLRNLTTTNQNHQKINPLINSQSEITLKNQSLDFSDFWNELSKQVEKFRKTTLNCTHKRCKNANTHLMQFFVDFNLAICLNDNLIGLDPNGTIYENYIKNCYKNAFECAFYGVFVSKKPQLCRRPMLLPGILEYEKSVSSEPVNNRVYNISGLDKSTIKDKETVRNNSNIKPTSDNNTTSLVLDATIPNNLEYITLIKEMVTVCENFKLETIDAKDILSHSEREKVKELLGEDLYQSTIGYLNSFFIAKNKSYKNFCSIGTKIAHAIEKDEKKFEKNTKKDSKSRLIKVDGITLTDIYELDGFVYFIIDSIRYVVLRPLPEKPYDHENGLYNLIDHKMAFIRHFLIEKNEKSLQSLYNLALRLKNLIIYFEDGSGKILFFDTLKTQRGLISSEDFKRQFYTHVSSGNLTTEDLKSLNEFVSYSQEDLVYSSAIKTLKQNKDHSKKNMLFNNIIETACVANALTLPACCFFKPDI